MDLDSVQYWIYPTVDGLDGMTVLADIWSLVNNSVSRYLWHQQLFNLNLVDSKVGWHLHGKVEYGDSINDEWMAVALLKYITSKMNTVAARVIDSDGEILLIEAAEHLPKWAGEPDLADGRVYLYNGDVHLVAPCSGPGDLTPFPVGTPQHGNLVMFLAKYPHLSLAKSEVQKCITERLGGFPENLKENHHTTNVLLPDVVAACITMDKQSVCDMINSLRDKDHLDLRKCRNMPRIRPDSRRLYSVTFPRCLYAILSSTDARPHRSSGWTIDESKPEELLGYKLSLGLEILASRYRRPGDQQAEDASSTHFIKKLQGVGYFQGELEGSRKYKELLEQAKQFFVNSTDNVYHSRLDKIMSSVEGYENGSLKAPEVGWLAPPGQPDSETWMEVTPESLDQMLAARFGVAQGGEDKIPGALNAFLNKMSDMTGVESNMEDDMNFKADDLIASMKKLLGENVNNEDTNKNENAEEEISDSDSDSDIENDDPVIIDYMSRLDAEIGGSVAGRSDLPDLEQPLQVDSNVLSNLLASYSAEFGFSGPTSAILNTIGVNPGVKKDS